MIYLSIQFAHPLDPLPEAQFYVVLMPYRVSREAFNAYCA